MLAPEVKQHVGVEGQGGGGLLRSEGQEAPSRAPTCLAAAQSAAHQAGLTRSLSRHSFPCKCQRRSSGGTSRPDLDSLENFPLCYPLTHFYVASLFCIQINAQTGLLEGQRCRVLQGQRADHY